MQADEQASRSPPHSLSLDHDVPPRPPSLAPVGRHHSFNIQLQSSSNSQERMLMSLPADYSTANDTGRQSSYKNQTRKVIKRQAANVDDSPYSYQENKLSNNNNAPSKSASKENFSYNNSYNRYTLPVLESNNAKGKTDNCQYWEEKNSRYQNDSNCPVYSVEISSRKKSGKSESLSKATGKKYDKNYARLDTVATIRGEKLANKYLCDIDLYENEFAHKMVKNVTDSSASKIYESMSGCSSNVGAYLREIDALDRPVKVVDTGKKHGKSEKPDSSASKIYESMSRCSNDVDSSINSFVTDTNQTHKVPTATHYVDMAISFKEAKHSSKYQESDNTKVFQHSKPLQDNTNRTHNSGGRRKSDKIRRRHTTEYRGPPHLILPPLAHDSSDSAEPSPTSKKSNNYPYSVLGDQKSLPKKNSITSSTSEENSDIVTAALNTRMQAKEWRENKPQRRVDSLTVDRRTTRKNASKTAKIKRRGSLNVIDPTTGMQLPLCVTKEKDMSRSMRSCNIVKSPLMDARKTSLKISAEDMVQIANCGARNKNGSLCHFISTNNENYLSISQALLDHSSSSEAKLTENKTLPRKFHLTETRKTTTTEDALCREDIIRDLKDKVFAKYSEGGRNKMDSIDRRHKTHTRQRSHDLDKSTKAAKLQQMDTPPNRKLVQTKSEGQRSYKQPAGYYLLENETGITVPLRLPEGIMQRKENVKYHSPSSETLDKLTRNIHHHLDGGGECRCLALSNHSLPKADCPVSIREKSDISSDTDPGNHMFRRFGTSSREELTNSEDVEETFDF